MKNYNIDYNVLQTAISTTFKNRQTPFYPKPTLFDVSFGQDTKRHVQWTAFLNKSGLKHVPFDLVHQSISQKLKPIYDNIINENLQV